MTHENVQKAIEKIRPMLQADGGDIALVRVDDNVVYVKLQGACGSCPMATYTLKMGVEAQLKELFPELKEVVRV
ncbi:MAG: NifU family protein [Treponemataceae bacterium]